MVVPVSLQPPRYGDGSGLVEYPRDPEHRRRVKREERRREAEAAAMEARVEQYEDKQRKAAVRSFFQRVFADGE